jgi:putative DNA methylase
MTVSIKTPKKLIEVALPLDAINVAAAKEKSIRQGHPSTLHLWWARRPLAAARAVIFAQMVNDPGYERSLGRGMNKEKAGAERERLFRILEQLVLWENTGNEKLFLEAQEEIWKSWRETCELNKGHPRAAELFNPEKLPAFHDPFAGGGALPLEAQRLGLESHASDLNPVAVTINKAMIEIPPRFAGHKPVGPPLDIQRQTRLHDNWTRARGLAEDIRRYGAWVRKNAAQRIGFLYPTTPVDEAMAQQRPELRRLVGHNLNVIAWIWARTVKSPNPAFSHVEVPLASTFVLSSKSGKESFVEPLVEGDTFRFVVRTGIPTAAAESGTKASGRGANFICLMSGVPISGDYIKAEGKAGRMGARLMAIVVEGERGRVYLAPTREHEELALTASPVWYPEGDVPPRLTGGTCVPYGLSKWRDLFTKRQLLALGTISDLVGEAVLQCKTDAINAGMSDDGISFSDGGTGATAYSQAIGIYLGLATDKSADYNSTICGWIGGGETLRNTFGRQALPMVWDFCEANILGESTGSFFSVISQMVKAVELAPAQAPGFIIQYDAQTVNLKNRVVSTDPPYYDNIGYADLSDFFYVWLRRCLRSILPDLFATLAVPKAEELVATPYRHGGRLEAEAFFLDGMTRAIKNLASQAHEAFPVTIYYAFKQSDTSEESGTANTGWDTFLEAIIRAGFSITGTWPMRTERDARSVSIGTNALASSIILVCRRRASNALTIGRREFLRELNSVLPDALSEMTRGGENSPVAPVDLSQAIIGPGMAIFSQYASVLEADGSTMSVRTALTLINRFLAEDDFDHETQFCLHWFDGQGWSTGRYGDADVLARAKGTSVASIADAGVIESGTGSVRLLRFAEYPKEWSPAKDNRTPVWEALHHMIRAHQDDGEAGAGKLLAGMPARAEPIRALAYRLYTLCERKGWAEEARAYNELMTSWTGIEGASQEIGHIGTQVKLDI